MPYPYLKKGVLIYAEDGKRFLLVNPYKNSMQKLSRLDSGEAVILKRFTGEDAVKDIGRALKVAENDILNVVAKFSSPDRNALEMLPKPLSASKAEKTRQDKHNRILLALRQEVVSSRRTEGNDEVVKEYHQRSITDAFNQFEDGEMTVSHIYREPHVLLGGKNYGAAFAEVLIGKGVIRRGMRILEIGGGTGIFGKSFLDEIKRALPKIYASLEYTFFDLSPTLLASQRKIAAHHRGMVRFVAGDIERHDFRREKFDLVISNEMVADLNVIKLTRADVEGRTALGPDKKKAIALIRQYGIDVSDAPKEFLFNLKAIEFLGLVRKLLKPEGTSYIVEYGSRWGYPSAVSLKGHVEHTIHFGHLAQAARHLNLCPRLTCLADFLPFNKEISVLDGVSFSSMQCCLFPFLDRRELPSRIYTEKMLKAEIKDVLQRLSGLSYACVGSGDVVLDPGNFFVLELSV